MKICTPNVKKPLLALACCFLFAAGGWAQTGVLITYSNGSQQGYSVATTGKLYFENGNLQVVQTGGSTPVSIPVTIIRKLTFSSAGSPLPLKMVDFTVFNDQAQITLSWKTANEVNTSYFLVERSADGTSYESIGQVASLNNSTGGSYNFIDPAPKTGTSYYRLKPVDADGKWEYSKVLTVKRTLSTPVTILPNPASDYFKINSTTTERLHVKIYAASGRLVMAGTYTPGESISISKLPPGMYSVAIDNKTYKLLKH